MFQNRAHLRTLLLAIVLIISVVVVGVASAGSNGNGPPVTVLTRNLYLGADLTPIFEAAETGDPFVVVQAITEVYLQAMASDIPARAAAVADEIAASEPHLVGLQEAVVWTSFDAQGNPVSIDFVQLILAELAARGQHYEAIAIAKGFDQLLPTFVGPVSLTVSDVILARADLPSDKFALSNVQMGNYFYRIVFDVTIPGGTQTVEIPRQWASVDVSLHGKSFRFITTHLESAHQGIRVGQALELLGVAAASPLPVVLLGDLNAEVNSVGDSAWLLINQGGFADAWSASQSKDPGYTCCQEPSLRLALSTLDERIDLVLTQGDFKVINAHVIGDEWINDPADPSHPVLWASDHAGVLVKLFIPKGGD